MFVLELEATLLKFVQNRPALVPLFQLPPNRSLP